MWAKSDGVIGVLTRALSASSLRQGVIAHNLANFNTPGFKRYTVRFEDEVGRALERNPVTLDRTHHYHLGIERSDAAAPSVEIDRSTLRRIDGNNVDLESEMIELVTNQLRYNAYVQQINNRFSQWRYVIYEGRR